MQTAILIFVVIFALALGFFLGLFLISMDAPFLKKLFQKEEPEESDPEASLTETVSPDESVLPPSKKPTPGSRLVLQVWKEEDQPPVYEFNGVYVDKEKLPQELLHMITVQEPADSPPEPQPAPPAEKEPQETTPDGEEEEEVELKMLSVVDEVNEILQHKLHGSPLSGKGIHLMENHNQEIRFWVGLKSYSDVSEIPEPEIREIINESVREWEQNRN